MTEGRWEQVFVGGTVLPMDGKSEPIANGAVAVGQGIILAVGSANELLDQAPTVEVIDSTNCLVMPGLVNTHNHMAMTLLRGFADDLPLQAWLEERVWPAEAKVMNRETVGLGTRLAAAEMIAAGITCSADMYFFDDEVARVLAKIGMRGVIAESMLDFETPRSKTTDEMFQRQRELIQEWLNHPLIEPSVAPHSPYSVSAADLVREAELAEEHNITLQIHIAETRWEVDKLIAEKGKSPVAYLAELGVLSERTVAAHCVHVSAEDVEILAELEVGVSHNPVSNLKLASGVAPVPAMLEAGCKLAMGTDGTASNNTLDLLRDAQIAALLHKGSAGDPTALPAKKIAEMITIDGARVLGLDRRIGSLEVGKAADIVCFDCSGLHSTPIFDPYSHLVYSARSSDAKHVMVQGKMLLLDGKHTTIDVDGLKEEVRDVVVGLRKILE